MSTKQSKIHIGLIIVALLPIVGELVRMPLLSDQGILVSDIAIGILVIFWMIQKISDQEKVFQNLYLSPLLFFTGIALFSLLQSLVFLKPSEVLSGSFYLLRFVEYTLLAVIITDKIKTLKQMRQLLSWVVFSALLIAIAGFIQLEIYPDLEKLTKFGWDPHQNRLVSTWLDPNFAGGLFALMISLLLGRFIYAKGFKKKLELIFIMMIFSVALVLTYSRSAYLAAGLGILTIGLLKSRKLLIIAIILGLAAFSVLPRAQERANDLIHSAQSLLFNTAENPDPTARLRIKSWDQTLLLILKKPWFGSGYNTLRSVKVQEGFVENTEVHSASGSDSSILTILATTGILGLVPFLWLYWSILATAFKTWRKKTMAIQQSKINESFSGRGYGLGLLAGMIGLVGHSFFVNSLLFPHIMIFIWILAGILNWAYVHENCKCAYPHFHPQDKFQPPQTLHLDLRSQKHN